MTALRSLAVELLTAYFKRARVPELFRELCQNPEQVTIVTESDSLIIEALLLSFVRRSGLKSLRALHTEASTRARSKDELCWVSLHDENALGRLLANESNQTFSTLNIFPVRGPIKNNPQHRIGWRRTLGILFLRRSILITSGKPFALSEGQPQTAKRLARQLKLDFYRNLKVVRGTPFQAIEVQERSILSGHEYERELKILAVRMGLSLAQVKRKAKSAFYEMAANPRRPLYGITNAVARFIVRRLFSDVITTGLDRLVPAVKDHTVVLVPMHRSHLDYILVGYKLYDSNLNPPLVAAGINLQFWPIGFFIRSVGGYFVKRNARHDRVHAVLLRRYVTYLIKRGHLQEFFIEGGRSRSGRMLPPRLGILSIMVEAFTKGFRKEISFVPVSIAYEQVVEAKTFGDENTGRKKEKESLIALLKARKIFRNRYGEVLINFGHPISLSEYAQRCRDRHPQGKLDQKALVVELAQTLTKRIRTQINVSLTNLAYSALIMAPRYGLLREDLVQIVRNMSRVVTLLKSKDPQIGEMTPSLKLFLAGRENLLEDLMRSGVVQVRPFLQSQAYFIPGEKRFTADFYRNSSSHHFVGLSLFSLAELMDGKITIDAALKFHNVFTYEYILGSEEEFKKELEDLAQTLCEHGILRKEGLGYIFVDRIPGIFVPALLQSSIQSLLWVYSNLQKIPEVGTPLSDVKKNDELRRSALRVLSHKELMTRLQNDFRTAGYLDLLTRTEASSKTALTSTLESLHDRQVISMKESSKEDKEVLLLKIDQGEIDLLQTANLAVTHWQMSAFPKQSTIGNLELSQDRVI